MVLNSTLVKQQNGVEINNFLDHTTPETIQFDNKVIAVSELPYEGEIIDASRALLARAALDSSIEVEEVEEPQKSLMHATQRAVYDLEARNMTKANAKSDYLERTYKSGHTNKVTLNVENGSLSQYGQSMMSVNANSLRYLQDETLRNRSRIETHNAVRQQKYFEAGLLKDYTMVTFSLVPQNISPEHAKKLGFFTETMSLAIQTVGNADELGVELESAFVAGADTPEERFDIEVVKELLAELGIAAEDMDTEQLLAQPILVHNSCMRDGVVDIVKIFDDITSRKTGDMRFYGRKDSAQRDYHAHKRECARREAVADEVAERTTRRLIAESSTFTNPTDATRRLHELNDAELKKLIVHDSSIDTNVLGIAALHAVEKARIHYANNDIVNMQLMMHTIRRQGASSSCPTGFGEGESSVVGVERFEANLENEGQEVGGKQEMTCPFCEEKTVGDPCADCITCTKCSASTKYSQEENFRRAQQYKKLKATKQASNVEISRIFRSMTKAMKANDGD